ncbi:PAS domain-containing protein [Halorussus gelatinilyticus]|uniref:histidine kinase n=1 Tax=Halorussus gelatinilyticus TaxID=2937524 RepID=A0A8U0IIP5_9EURY|nr:PAS domain-containing protein [Halorussus gelatinilyticus]UPW00565.1 PAS domain-containing protein [Halorussus gelatinilyticus]
MATDRTSLAEVRKTVEGMGTEREPVTAGGFADEVGWSRQRAAEKLDELVERGDARCKQTGEGGRVWWLTDREDDDERLRRERNQTEQLLKTSPVAIWVRDSDGSLVLANQRAREILGVSERDVREESETTVDVNVYDANGNPLLPDERPSAEVRDTGEPLFNEELFVETASGERTWLSVNVAPVFDPDGELDRVIITAEDITALKQRERELETELSETLGRISDAFYALDEEYRFTHVNEQAEELLQHSEAELLGESLWEMFPESAETDEVWDSFHTAMETQEATSYELYYPPLDFWVEANVYPSETGVSVYFRDVTERVQREQELRESERRYRTLAENFPEGLVTLFDEDRRYTLATGRAFEYLDESPEDVEGHRPEEVWTDETVADTVDEALQSALDGSPESVETTYSGREWILHAVPITDDDGDISMGTTMALDITERKEHERRLERFASVVSHGLRNPLSIAQMYLNMAQDGGEPDDFEQVEQALDRMETIIENLLTTTRRGQTISGTEPVSLAEASEAAWQNVKTGDATLRVEEDVGTVSADAEQLQTVLENLFRNSIEHAGADGAVRVGSLDGGFYVEDDGPGIPPEESGEIFEYGYTSGSGSGIGLAVVKDIVDVHGWDISVTEGANGGARFEIRGVKSESSDANP